MLANIANENQSQYFIAGGMFERKENSLAVFDTTDEVHPAWTNLTTHIPYFNGPATQFVPFGERGVLISIGGFIDHRSTQQRDMSLIQVFDIATQIWSAVLAIGDVPEPRSNFCSALSAASDQSSFQLTIYGGLIEIYGNTTDELYVLSMPSFQWVKISETENSNTEVGNPVGRVLHSCLAYNDRQMFVLGGKIATPNGSWDTSHCIDSLPGIKLLDMTTFEWYSEYPIPNTTYEVPQQVINIIGGGPDGGARDAAAWQPRVDTGLFGRITSNDRSTSFGTPTSAPEGTTHPATHSRNRTVIIAGAVTGGVIGVALFGVVAFEILGRRTRKQGKRKPNVTALLPDQPNLKTLGIIPKSEFEICEIQGDNTEAIEMCFIRELEA
ncbi:uncharacterized protein KY384_000743 [Bacidia gigantensis]|uniref:uncharacterized protein n=1 Tax=Bacidia gigantensis TaxID=2732470 RepID=UPI001D041C6F|nr:uncharacterized protein KY384_000743 [Bacidia gigantensis]KAG8525981.1 hypothetical protein KY384_000743 [Bacidia gigantensis]